MGYFVENFTNIHDLIKATNARQFNSVFINRDHSSDTPGKDFYGTNSYAEAVELLRNGYTDPLENIKRGVEMNLRKNTTQKAMVKNDITGYAPCVPNAILGIPQAMINKEITGKKSKIITIIHDCTGAGTVSAETFIKAGIVTLTIVNALEVNGFRVALKVVFKNASVIDEYIFASVTLKDWRQPLDLKKMCFPFCHPSMLRRIGFRYTETQPNIKNSGWAFGYGQNAVASYDYETLLNRLRQNNLIKENEKYINIRLCEENDFNPQTIAKLCGLE